MKNCGETPLRIRGFDFKGDVSILREGDGRPAEYVLQAIGGEQLPKFVLSPQQAVSDAIDILHWYIFPKPGKYCISANYDSRRDISGCVRGIYEDCDHVVVQSDAAIYIDITVEDTIRRRLTEEEWWERWRERFGVAELPPAKWWQFWRW